MKTIQTLQTMIDRSVTYYREYAKQLRADLKTIEDMVTEDVIADRTPTETVTRAAETIGRERTEEIIASLVSHLEWDGRISQRARQWALSNPNAWDDASIERLWLYSSKIHPAHLNQIALEMIKLA